MPVPYFYTVGLKLKQVRQVMHGPFSGNLTPSYRNLQTSLSNFRVSSETKAMALLVSAVRGNYVGEEFDYLDDI